MSDIYKRTHMCGVLTEKNIEEQVVLNGWVQKRRNLGGLIFCDIRDKTGIVQVVFNDKIPQELFEKADEKPTNSFLYSLSMGTHGQAMNFTNYNDYLTNDKLFLFQSNTIRDMAEKDSCVIIGRCADYILRGRKDMLSVFIHAPMELRIQRISRVRNVEEDAARSLIKKTDRQRANYYNFYADNDWGAADSYDVAINSGKLGVEKSIEVLAGICEHL